MSNNRKANLYREIGGDAGAYKSKGKWIYVAVFRYHPELVPKPAIRWQGPPSKVIVEALKEGRRAR